MLLFFFFSSRRRHTRFDCDWSSDVCSSDLDVRAHAVLFDAQVRLTGHFVQRARASVLDIDDADGHDAAAKWRKSPGTPRGLRVALVEPADEVVPNVRVVLLPRSADSLDVDD